MPGALSWFMQAMTAFQYPPGDRVERFGTGDIGDDATLEGIGLRELAAELDSRS